MVDGAARGNVHTVGSERAALVARHLLLARLRDRPGDPAALRALERVDAARRVTGTQLELDLPETVTNPIDASDWPVSGPGARLAQRLLVDRLHVAPGDHAASRALKAVVDTVAGNRHDGIDDWPGATLVGPRPCRSRLQHRSRDERSALRGARDATAAIVRRVPALLGRVGARAASRVAARAARGGRTLARVLDGWCRQWVSLTGLRRIGRAVTSSTRTAARIGTAVGTGSLLVALATVSVFGGADLVGRLSLVDARVDLRPLARASTIYAADGSPLALLGVEDREPVAFRDIPRVLVDAVVAAEDQTFWTNAGVDVSALIRALVTNVQAGRVAQGGSTITEQLAKNRILDPERDTSRKLQQLALALAIDASSPKRRVLTQYLNTVYFGRGAYGVRAAARRYFRPWDANGASGAVALHNLTLGQAALLAGLIASPLTYDPFEHPDRAQARRAHVLQRMVELGFVSREAAERASAEPLPSVPPVSDLRPRDIVVDEVQQRLLADPRLGASPAERRDRLLKGGLAVYTTIDPTAQARAEQAIAETLPDDPRFTAALVAIDPATGHVLAMAGGPGYEELQYNLATHTPGRQAGSTFKVITLAAALEAGYSPNDLVDGSSPCTATRPGYPVWSTVNAEPGGGWLTLRAATAGSVNCAFARVIASLGPPAVIDMAHRLGIDQPIPNYLPITLGASETTPLEMATVASTLAAGGIRHDPVFVARVVAPDGRVLLDDTRPPGRRVLDPSVAGCVTHVLRDAVERGTGTAARLPGVDVAGKTGTTDDHGDAWFLGYTANLAAVVWMGAPVGRVPMTNVGGIRVFGGTYPARIWRAFASAVLEGRPVPGFPEPGSGCGRPGTRITDAGRSALTPRDEQGAGPTPTGRTSTPAPPPPSPTSPPPTPPAAAAPSVTTTAIPTVPSSPPSLASGSDHAAHSKGSSLAPG